MSRNVSAAQDSLKAEGANEVGERVRRIGDDQDHRVRGSLENRRKDVFVNADITVEQFEPASWISAIGTTWTSLLNSDTRDACETIRALELLGRFFSKAAAHLRQLLLGLEPIVEIVAVLGTALEEDFIGSNRNLFLSGSWLSGNLGWYR